MAKLEKKRCSVIISNILYEIFKENMNDFPIEFDDFGKQITIKLYKQFQLLEGNKMILNKETKIKESVFENYTDCVSKPEQEILELTEEIILVDSEAKTTDQEIIEDIEKGLIKEPELLEIVK